MDDLNLELIVTVGKADHVPVLEVLEDDHNHVPVPSLEIEPDLNKDDFLILEQDLHLDLDLN